MKNPKLTVIIPTRERADTLFHTLRTVIEQDYENLEIIVSDNASIDNTEAIVRSFSDPRLYYINTGQRLGMSENWEFALGYVTGDFVMYLGDDDGLLPDACNDVARIIYSTDAKAVIWLKPDYIWPSLQFLPNTVSIHCAYDLFEIEGKIILNGIARGKTSYGKLPVLYSGFVSVQSILNIKKKTGHFFHSITPDVYSGIVLAEELKTYLYSFRPFSISGGSRHSNGIASVTDDTKAKRFFTENKLEINQTIPVIRGSVQSHLAEAFLQAKNVNLLSDYRLNHNRIHLNIFNDLYSIDHALKKEGLERLLTLNLNSKNKKLVKREMELMNTCTNIVGNENIFSSQIPLNGHLRFNCDSFGVENSYDASKLIGTIIGKYQMPASIKKATFFSFVLIYIIRKISIIFSKYLFPF
jgi:glycosyltransferase involved in cell wall biosynthesis